MYFFIFSQSSGCAIRRLLYTPTAFSISPNDSSKLPRNLSLAAASCQAPTSACSDNCLSASLILFAFFCSTRVRRYKRKYSPLASMPCATSSFSSFPPVLPVPASLAAALFFAAFFFLLFSRRFRFFSSAALNSVDPAVFVSFFSSTTVDFALAFGGRSCGGDFLGGGIKGKIRFKSDSAKNSFVTLAFSFLTLKTVPGAGEDDIFCNCKATEAQTKYFG
mmetsp:Transcript_3228/g.4876  ORF Transcript_3228/g.4876 Transcript_3228/m.4876 type:complete len:220 (-) Transcript_3228:439-1098(-)